MFTSLTAIQEGNGTFTFNKQFFSGKKYFKNNS